MEGRFQRIFLTAAASLLLSCAALAAPGGPDDLDLEALVLREPERRDVRVDAIDTENVELGLYGGIMSVEDFGSEPVVGVRLAYHVSEHLFVEAVYARTELGETSFERLSGGAQLLTDDERDMSFYNVSLGYNLLPGEAYLGGWAFKGGLYLAGGVGSTEFGGDERFTLNVGAGYRLAATDWLALRLDVRDHVFDSDLLGANETRHNIEFSAGLTVFF